MEINELCKIVYESAVSKGWMDPENVKNERIPQDLCLIHSEVSEALEEYRKGFRPSEERKSGVNIKDLIK